MNIQKYIYSVSLALAAAFALSSCDSMFRDAPVDKLAENEIWGSEKLLDEYTGSWYRHMDNGFTILVSTIIKNLGEEFDPWFGDQLTVGRRDWYQSAYGDLLNGSQVMISNRSNLIWQTQYEQIRSLNKLIEHENELPAQIHDRIMGEAHFFRAWYYYTLLRRYGGVLLIDKTYDPLVHAETFPRASYDATVEFIAKEAFKASQLLPAQHEASHVGRATKGAAFALMGKVYYWAAGAKFQNVDNAFLGYADNRTDELLGKAADAYDELFKLKVYDLVEINTATRESAVAGYRNIFLTKNSVESILEVQHSDNGDFIYGFGHKLDRDATLPSLGGTNCAYNPTQNHVDEYFMANGKTIADPGYDPANPYENRDIRFYANILYDGAIWRGHTVNTHYETINGKRTAGEDLVAYGTSTTASYTRTGYYMAKFLRESQTIDDNETFASSQNYIIWRFAEILLDYAEIDFKLGRPGNALEKVNRIRKRVGIPSLDDVTLADIERERRVELAFEKTTYWDILRNGQAEQKLNGSRNPLYGITIDLNADGSRTYKTRVVNGNNDNVRYFDSRQYFWPIHWDDIRYHSIDQNPGWSEY